MQEEVEEDAELLNQVVDVEEVIILLQVIHFILERCIIFHIRTIFCNYFQCRSIQRLFLQVAKQY